DLGSRRDGQTQIEPPHHQRGGAGIAPQETHFGKHAPPRLRASLSQIRWARILPPRRPQALRARVSSQLLVRQEGVSPPALLGVAIGIGLIVASELAGKPALLVWNASPSQPVGLYRVQRRSARLGDRVLARLPPRVAALAARRGYLARGTYLLKPVAAVPGDRVCRWSAKISVRGRPAGRANWRDQLRPHLPAWPACY